MKRFAQDRGFNPVMWAGYRVVLGCTMLGCKQPNLRGYDGTSVLDNEQEVGRLNAAHISNAS